MSDINKIIKQEPENEVKEEMSKEKRDFLIEKHKSLKISEQSLLLIRK